MLNPIYKEKCINCNKNQHCSLCQKSLCDICALKINDHICCRECSPSIRNDKTLISYFIDWHSSINLDNVKLTKQPKFEIHKFQKESTFSVVEFECQCIIGSIIYRSDAQCDLDAINKITGETLFIEYRILINETEIGEFLKSVYANIQALHVEDISMES